MPGITQYVLKGGPCDGKHGDLTPQIDATGQLNCGGDVYKRAEPVQVENGREVFKDAGKVPNPKPDVPSPKAHAGWNHLARTLRHHFPHAIKEVHRDTDAALRSISRGRKVHR